MENCHRIGRITLTEKDTVCVKHTSKHHNGGVYTKLYYSPKT